MLTMQLTLLIITIRIMLKTINIVNDNNKNNVEEINIVNNNN